MPASSDNIPRKQRKPSVGRNGVPTPPGFEAHPERRHNGAWKKEDTARYKLEQMMKLSSADLLAVEESDEAPMFERKLAKSIRKGEWREIREMIEQVYGRPKESMDLTSAGEPVTLPTFRIIDERVKTKRKKS